ncbi:hypothetical protein R1sor_008879 [Riccia sorocarpa]|uniref:Uncharacterized protein n=1 Tax=Riccia sorocarpa TaxID=122646 RepID=A0ABD3H7G3_9MARC
MEDKVYLTFRGSEDTDLLPCTGGEAVVDINYCRARWNLVPDSIYISGRAPHGGELLNVFVQKSGGTWTLLAGKRYTIFRIVDLAQSVQGILPPTSQAAPTSTVTGPTASTTASTTWDGIPPDPSVVSSYTALRDIKGRSELSKLSIPEFTHLPVVRLPDLYNGNIVFELPPLTKEDVLKKGAILEGLDKAHACWIWTKMTTTSASIAISNTAELADTPIVINGEIRTTTVKRKSAYSTGIGKTDTHRHDKVARTQQTIRLVRGRLVFGAEIDSPPNSPDREDLTQPARDYTRNIDDLRAEVRSPPNSPDREDLTQLARVYTRDNDNLRAEVGSPLNSPDREDLTQPERVYPRNIDDLCAEVGSPPNLPDRNYLTQPARVAVNDTRNTHDLHEDTLQEAQHDNLEPARVAAHLTIGTSPARTIHERPQAYENTRVRENQEQELPQTATVTDHLIHATNNGDDIRGDRPARRHSEIHTISSDTSSDVVIIERTPRRRPPTRAYPIFRVETDNDNRAKQFGIPVDEVDADVTKWHLSRTSKMGAGPPCYAATPGRSAPRSHCKTKIRHVGISRRGVGVVAPSFLGKQTYLAMERQYRFGFVRMAYVTEDLELTPAGHRCQEFLKFFPSSAKPI